jgi:hypothetical protein
LQPSLFVLLSTRHRFVFLATLKTASTAIEAALAPHANIQIGHTRFGKHMTLTELLDRFAFIFEEEPFERFESFAVVREPAERLGSLYRSHQDPWFEEHKPERWTGRMSFEDFLSDWLPRHPQQAVSQARQLTDEAGRGAVGRLVTFEEMPRLFPGLAADLVPGASFGPLPRRNQSRARRPLTLPQRSIVHERYADDLALYRRIRREEAANTNIPPKPGRTRLSSGGSLPRAAEGEEGLPASGERAAETRGMEGGLAAALSRHSPADDGEARQKA